MPGEKCFPKRGKPNPHPSGFSHREVHLVWNPLWRQVTAVNAHLTPDALTLRNFEGIISGTLSCLNIQWGISLASWFLNQCYARCLFLITVWQLTAHSCFLIYCVPFCRHHGLFILLLFIVGSPTRLWAPVMIFLRAEISLQQLHKWKVTQRINRCNERTNVCYKLALRALIAQESVSPRG